MTDDAISLCGQGKQAVKPTINGLKCLQDVEQSPVVLPRLALQKVVYINDIYHAFLPASMILSTSQRPASFNVLLKPHKRHPSKLTQNLLDHCDNKVS